MARPTKPLLLTAVLFAGTARAFAQPAVQSPRVIEQPAWIFPHAAERAGLRDGEVRAVLSISEEGELLDFLIVGATHPAFAQAVAEKLPSYRFTPGRVRGEPTTVRMPMSFWFRQEGTLTTLTALDYHERRMNTAFGDERTLQSWLCPIDRLDRPLKTIELVEPRYPDELRHRSETGSVRVDFYIDGEGRVRMPATGSTSHPSFARMVVAALQGWRFEPPTSNGQPVIVHVSQVFNFPAPSAPAGKPTAD